MSTANLRRLLDKATARPWHGAHIFDGENVIQYGHDNAFRCHVAITQTEVDMDLIVELVNSADELLAEIANLRAANDMLAEYAKSTRHDYTELLYAVGKKYPDETRHETALRYIRQAEAPQNDMCKDEALEQNT